MTDESEQQKDLEDWRDEVSDESREILKIADGEEVEFVFLDQGKKKTHPDYGTSVIFLVSQNEQEKLWYVNANNFDLLKQIKALGDLNGKKAKVSRQGSKKSDTRYTLIPIEKQE